jgi:DNA-binding transcriptional ArsR family regulator
VATDHLSTTLAALADPTRRAILARLAEGEATVNDLAAPLPMSLPAVSRHLKVLEKAGLIKRGREAQWRPCRLEAEPLREVSDWVGRYREFWEERLDRLDDYLREIQAEAKGNEGKTRPPRRTSEGTAKEEPHDSNRQGQD